MYVDWGDGAFHLIHKVMSLANLRRGRRNPPLHPPIGGRGRGAGRRPLILSPYWRGENGRATPRRSGVVASRYPYCGESFTPLACAHAMSAM